jgi:excisionase family DNA binding protein
MSNPCLFDIAQAVGYFHEIGAKAATRNFVRTLIISGGIPHLKLGRKFYVSKTAIDEWLAKHERRTK